MPTMLAGLWLPFASRVTHATTSSWRMLCSPNHHRPERPEDYRRRISISFGFTGQRQRRQLGQQLTHGNFDFDVRVGREGATHARPLSHEDVRSARLPNGYSVRPHGLTEERREAQHQPVRRSPLNWPALRSDVLVPSGRLESAGASTSASWRVRRRHPALIAQITRPIRRHVAGMLRASFATDNDPIDPAPKPRSQIKQFK